MTDGSLTRALIVFGREPRPGQVKTRLIPALGAEGAARLYRRLLSTTLAIAAETPAERRALWLDGPERDGMAANQARRFGLSVHQQHGGDLGGRMAHAFGQTLSNETSAVLIGSDCPEYTAAYLTDAFDALRHADAVIGPAGDGGYVLIGLRRRDRRLFDGIAWGGDGVLTATRERLKRLAWSWYELPTLHDLDRPEDLDRFPALAGSAGVSQTGQGPG